MFKIENIISKIEILDFSSDNLYVLYKDFNEEVVITSITSQKRVNIIYVEQNLHC